MIVVLQNSLVYVVCQHNLIHFHLSSKKCHVHEKQSDLKPTARGLPVIRLSVPITSSDPAHSLTYFLNGY